MAMSVCKVRKYQDVIKNDMKQYKKDKPIVKRKTEVDNSQILNTEKKT